MKFYKFREQKAKSPYQKSNLKEGKHRVLYLQEVQKPKL